MKWEQIQEQFDNEWVLIECTKLEEDTFEIIEGNVVYHNPDKEKVYQKLSELQSELQGIAVEYIGEIPKDFAVIL